MKRTSYFARVTRSTGATVVRVRPLRNVFARRESAWSEAAQPAAVPAATAAAARRSVAQPAPPPEHPLPAAPPVVFFDTSPGKAPAVAASPPGLSRHTAAAENVIPPPPTVADSPEATAERDLQAHPFNPPPQPLDEPRQAPGRQALRAQVAAAMAKPAAEEPRQTQTPFAAASPRLPETVVMQPTPPARMPPGADVQLAEIQLPRAESSLRERADTTAPRAEASQRMPEIPTPSQSFLRRPEPPPVIRQTSAAQPARHDTVRIESLEIVLTAPPPPTPRQRVPARAVKTPVAPLSRDYAAAFGWKQR
jgi:hypothetical protein